MITFLLVVCGTVNLGVTQSTGEFIHIIISSPRLANSICITCRAAGMSDRLAV